MLGCCNGGGHDDAAVALFFFFMQGQAAYIKYAIKFCLEAVIISIFHAKFPLVGLILKAPVQVRQQQGKLVPNMGYVVRGLCLLGSWAEGLTVRITH